MRLTFASVSAGTENWAGGLRLPRHRHEHGYVCLVLKGRYEEAGDCGRRLTRSGDVNFHGPFDAHLDRFAAAATQIINFTLPGWREYAVDYCCVRDPDLIARTAERDHDEARELLLSMLEPMCPAALDWPDELASAIRCRPDISLSSWAQRRGLAPATVSRGFRSVYEVSPSAFRAQLRARRAWRSLMHGDLPLSALACEHGFADQAHMTRAVGAITGRTPLQWRRLRSNRFKT